MSYPEEIKIALYGFPADIVGAFASSYLGMSDIDERYKTKYQYIDVKANVPIRAKILNFNALPFEDEEKDFLFNDFVGHLMVFKTQEAEIFKSDFLKKVRDSRIPFFAVIIDSTITQIGHLRINSEESNFNLKQLFKWLIENAYDFQKTHTFTKRSKICLITHQDFVSHAPEFYKIVKEQEQQRQKIEHYLKEIGIVNGAFIDIPNPTLIEQVFKKYLNRFSYIKLADAIDILKNLHTRFSKGELSRDHYLALANLQAKKIIDHLLMFL